MPSLANEKSQKANGLRGTRIVIASKTAWSILNYRRELIRAIRSRHGSVIATAISDHYDSRLASLGLAFEKAPISARGIDPFSDLRLSLFFLCMFLRVKPQVVHSFSIKPVLYGTLAAWLAGVPAIVCTITGLGYSFAEGNPLLRQIVTFLYRMILGRAGYVFFQNDADRDYFLNHRLVRAERSEVVPGSGVNLAHFEVARFREGIGSRPLRFLMLSRLVRDKGIAQLCRAAEQLARNGIVAEYRLLGPHDPVNPDALSASDVEELTRSPVQWCGNVDDVRPEIADADVIVLPTLYREGVPRSLLEGMAVGRPIITTDMPGCRDLIVPGRTGILISRGGHAALAQAMLRFIRQPDLAIEMGRHARQLVESSYDETYVVKRSLDIYQKLLRSTL